MGLLLLTASAISFIILYKIVLIVCANYTIRKKLSHIPGPANYPVIGTLQLLKKSEARMKWFLSLLNNYKDGILLFWLGPWPIVYVFKPELLQTILSSTLHVEKASHYDLLKLLIGDGLVTAPAKRWIKDRKLLTPTFHFNILEQFAVIMYEKAEIAIKHLEKKITENPAEAINIIPFAQEVTFDIIHATAMGVNVDDEKKKSIFTMNLSRYLELFSHRKYRLWFWIDWIYYLSPQGREYRSVVNSLHEYTDEVIRKRKLKRNMQNGESQANKQHDPDILNTRKRKAFLDLLLDINEKDDTPLTDKHLRSQVTTFIFAGHDTTSFSITWALFAIGHNPKCQEKIHEELEAIFKDSQKPATENELSQLKYLERVIKEARRLYATVPSISRKLMEDIKLNDYLIPKGTTVTVSIMLLHRNPAIWADPLTFDPDRFLPENLKRIHPYAYIPFSAGPRNCIGQKFAILEEKIILTAVLRKWRVKSVEKPEDITLNDFFILRPHPESIHLRFIPKT